MNWTPAITNPKRDGDYAVRFTWSDRPAVAFWSARLSAWRDGGRTLRGIAAWCELPPYTPPAEDARLCRP